MGATDNSRPKIAPPLPTSASATHTPSALPTYPTNTPKTSSRPKHPTDDKSLHVIISSFGSQGDVDPAIWLATGFQRLGHRPTLILTENYSHLAGQAGIPCYPVSLPQGFESVARDPRFWAPFTGPAFVSRTMLSTLPYFLEAIKKAPPPDLMVASTFSVAAACFAESKTIPLVHLHLQPCVLQSARDFPVFSHSLAWLCKSPLTIRHIALKVMETLASSVLKTQLNTFRKSLRLQPVKNPCRWLIGTKIILPVPQWFAPPPPDWPTTLFQCQFPFLPLTKNAHPPHPIQSLIKSQKRIVFWTHGSANFDTHTFWKIAIQTTRALSLASLLVGPEPPAEQLPPDSIHLPHIPFDSIMPFCHAIVHHGGIGTTAKAIAAGLPQLIIPRSHDQPDNAARAKKLGLALSIPWPSMRPDHVTSLLAKLLTEPSFKIKAAGLAALAPNPHPESAALWAIQSARESSIAQNPRANPHQQKQSFSTG